MWKWFAWTVLLGGIAPAQTVQAKVPPVPEMPANLAFEVATIKPVDPGPHSGRLIRMENNHSYIATNFTLQMLVAAAYRLNPHEVSGGTGWMRSDKFSIRALTPGREKPTGSQQAEMLRTLLNERFHLKFHWEAKTLAVFVIVAPKGGGKLKTTQYPGEDAVVTSVVYRDHVELPARGATMNDFAAALQRVVLDRPVVDATGIAGQYDFDLSWVPDESQYGGELQITPDSTGEPLVVAMKNQLGLELKSARRVVQTLVIDNADQPDEN